MTTPLKRGLSDFSVKLPAGTVITYDVSEKDPETGRNIDYDVHGVLGEELEIVYEHKEYDKLPVVLEDEVFERATPTYEVGEELIINGLAGRYVGEVLSITKKGLPKKVKYLRKYVPPPKPIQYRNPPAPRPDPIGDVIDMRNFNGGCFKLCGK